MGVGDDTGPLGRALMSGLGRKIGPAAFIPIRDGRVNHGAFMAHPQDKEDVAQILEFVRTIE